MFPFEREVLLPPNPMFTVRFKLTNNSYLKSQLFVVSQLRYSASIGVGSRTPQAGRSHHSAAKGDQILRRVGRTQRL